MAIKKFRPLTPSRRYMTVAVKEVTPKVKPLKSLTTGKKRVDGRSTNGRITTRFRGGGHKRKFRAIDFCRDKVGIPGKVASIEYDPNRSAYIALINYVDGEKRYIVAPEALKVGDTVEAGPESKIKPGNSLPLKRIPLGTSVYNIEMQKGKGGQIARSAGNFGIIIARDREYVLVRLPSGEQRNFHQECSATVGRVSNPDHMNEMIGKAGRSRWKGRRPHVRGSCMNPVDHPHGGGEGKSKGGRHPVSPWGQPTKGYKTRKPNKPSDKYIVQRRKRKRK